MFLLFTIILIIDALVLTAAVLLQAGQGGGLASLGGGASTDTFLGGRQATTVLTKLSWWCGGLFLGLSLLLAGISTRSGSATRSVLEGQIEIPTPISAPPIPLDLTPEQTGAGPTAPVPADTN